MMDIFDDSSEEEGSDNEVQVLSHHAQTNVVVHESQETLLATQSQIPMVAKQQTPMPIKKREVYGGNTPGGGIPSFIHAADTPGSVGMESMTQPTFTTENAPEEMVTFLANLDTAKTNTARVSLSPEKTSILFTKAPPRKRSTKQPPTMSSLEAIGSQATANLLITSGNISGNMTAEALRAYEESKERVEAVQMDVHFEKSKPASSRSGDSAVIQEEDIHPPKEKNSKTIEKCGVEKPTTKEAFIPIDKPKKSTKETKQEMQTLRENPTTKVKTKGKLNVLAQTIEKKSRAGDQCKKPPDAAETASPKVGNRTAKARAVKAKIVDKEISDVTNVGVKAPKPAAPVKNTSTTKNDEATSTRKLATEEALKQSTEVTVKKQRTSVTIAEPTPKPTTKMAVSDSKVASTKTAEETTAPKSANGPPNKKKRRTFQDQVLAEMFFSCKPYTLKTLSQALQTTEAALHHVMLSLVDKQIVVKKEFASSGGRSKELYWANQESKAKEIQGLLVSPQEISAAREELQGLQREELEIQKQMAILALELSNPEIDNRLHAMEGNLVALRSSLVDIHNRIKTAKLQQQQSQKVVGPGVSNKKTPAQLAKERCPRRIKIRINYMRDEWKKRKDKCMDFIDQLADGMEKKPKDVVKLLDLETDEMEGVAMPAKHEID